MINFEIHFIIISRQSNSYEKMWFFLKIDFYISSIHKHPLVLLIKDSCMREMMLAYYKNRDWFQNVKLTLLSVYCRVPWWCGKTCLRDHFVSFFVNFNSWLQNRHWVDLTDLAFGIGISVYVFLHWTMGSNFVES